MLASDLSEQALANAHEIESELACLRRRYGETGSIDLHRYGQLSRLDVLVTATAAVAAQMARYDGNVIGRNGK